jgi:hypothetical protein
VYLVLSVVESGLLIEPNIELSVPLSRPGTGAKLTAKIVLVTSAC